MAVLIFGPALAVERDPAANRGYKALFAAAIQRHTPRRCGLGKGGACCRFDVTASGRVEIVAASGSSPAHAALARRIVESVRAPPPPGGAFRASQCFHFF